MKETALTGEPDGARAGKTRGEPQPDHVVATPGHDSPFRFERQRNELRFRVLRLALRTWITPQYVRLRLEGMDLAGFDSRGADDHIRLFFPSTEIGPSEVDGFRNSPSRDITPLSWDAEEGWLDVELTIHPGAGVASPWAADAPIGSLVGQGGPRGSKVMIGRPEAWFLAGDETAVPAIRRFLADAGADATGMVLVETEDAQHEIPLAAPKGVTVEYVHRDGVAAGLALSARLDRITAAERLAGTVIGFVAAESSVVGPARALLLDRWALRAEAVTARGYWKRGVARYDEAH
ncbi:siderophore-interacting protein [Microbacterium phosphatis]|uniref:siderophore-interacting protein n=1 Tax=Microbacterium phosphatis TaxID=3140248 RepID=UPI003140610E